MTLLRIVSVLTIVTFLILIALGLKRRKSTWKAVRASLWIESKAVILFRRESGRSGLAAIRLLVYRMTVICFFILGLSGFLPIVFLGEHLTGTLLIIHVTIAPLFALLLAAMALLWAHRLRLRENDWRCLVKLFKRQIPERDPLSRCLLRAGFWSILLTSLPLILAVILGLYPLFGTEGIELLVSLHAYSALVLTLLALMHIYGTMTMVNDSFENHVKE